MGVVGVVQPSERLTRLCRTGSRSTPGSLRGLDELVGEDAGERTTLPIASFTGWWSRPRRVRDRGQAGAGVEC